MSGRAWRFSERVLVGVVIGLAALVIIRLVTKESGRDSLTQRVQSHEAAPSPETQVVPGAESVPPSPACVELLARIRSCSEKDLEGIVDQIGGLEAYNLYNQLTPSDRQEVFSALPTPIIAKKANALLGIPEPCFRNAGKPGMLASSLVDAAMGKLGDTADPQQHELSFATEIDAQGVPQRPRRSFRSDERKIYACLDAGSESQGESGVLVRWTEEGSGALVYLHYQPLTMNRRWNHVYFEVADKWPLGNYRVNFYRLGKSVSLLAGGTYVVGSGN